MNICRLGFIFLAFYLMPVIGAAASSETFTFGVVPQQSASKLARIWQPILTEIEAKTGISLQFKTAKNIPEFEANLRSGAYDFAYMNPYHYVVFHDLQGYQAIARRGGSDIKGIIVVPRNSDIQSLSDLSNNAIAFPSPAAFAASILPRAHLNQQGIKVMPRYVASHDSVYMNVAQDRMFAGGGIMRTLNAVPDALRSKLRVLWTSKGFTPHAVAVHARIRSDAVKKVKRSMLELHLNDGSAHLLQPLKIPRFIRAADTDWDDVRALNLTELAQ